QGRPAGHPRRAQGGRGSLCASHQRRVDPMVDSSDLDRTRAPGDGEEILLASNAPLPLDSGREVWIVEAGTAEVFAVPDHGEGPRTHLWTATAGQLLCSLDPERSGGGLGLLAVGHPG